MLVQSIPAPAAGATSVVAVEPGHLLEFSYDISTALFEREDKALLITFQDGRRLELSDFFVVETEGDSLPFFRLADGSEIASADFLLALNPEMDITAAGPSAPGSGSSYDDDAGALLDGLNRMGMQETPPFSSGSSLFAEDPLHDGPGLDEAPPLIGGVTLPEPSPIPLPPSGVRDPEKETDTDTDTDRDNNDSGITTPVTPQPPRPQTPDSGVNLKPGVSDAFTLAADEAALKTAPVWTDAKTMIITAPDGLASVNVNGTRIIPNAGGQTVPGLYGELEVTLTANPNGDYTLEYRYQLTDPMQHPDGDGRNTIIGENFTVVVTDADGDSASQVIEMAVTDGVPELAAAPGTDVSPGKEGSGSLTVDAGADGADWGSVTVNDKPVVFDADGKGSVTLDNGMRMDLERHDDDTITYTYTVPKDADHGAEYEFTFGIKDTDGDPAEVTVTHRVTDNGLTLAPDASGSFGLTADEADLSSGTAWSETKTITINAPDGLDSVTINGTKMDLGQGVQTIPGQYGQLEVSLTANPDGTYSLEYTYQLTGPALHPDGDGRNVVMGEEFTVVVIDADGDSASRTLGMSIIDDIPVARNDGPLLVVEGHSNSLNILDNDSLGADAPASGTITGAVISDPDGTPITLFIGQTRVIDGFGAVTLEADGVLTFVADVVQGDAAIADRTVTYTIRDADGDESSAQVILSRSELGNPQIAACPSGMDLTVQEHGLVAKDGSNIASGFFTVDAEAGLGSVTVTLPHAGSLTLGFGDSGSLKVVHEGVTYGVLTVSTSPYGTVTYSFALNAALDNAAADKPAFLSELTGESGTLQLEVRVTDALGQESAPATIAVSIVDDAPSAMDDAPLLVKEGGSKQLNVLDNDSWGADAPAKGTVTGAVISDPSGTPVVLNIGESTDIPGFGTVTLKADGTLTFTAVAVHGNDPIADRTVTYTIRDSDGDESSAQVILGRSELGNPQIVASPGNPDMEVQERGLVTQDGSDTASGVFTVDAEAGLGSVTFTIPGADALTINFGESGSVDVVHDGITYGTLTVSAAPDGTVTYSFTLNAALDNAAADKPAFLSELSGESGTLQLEVRVTDALGQESAPATIAVSIVDDAPSAMDDAPLLVKEGGSKQLNVLDNDSWGADAPAKGTVTGAVISDPSGTPVALNIGESTDIPGFGTVTLEADGTLTFTAVAVHGNDPIADRIVTYTIRDLDGDESSAQVILGRSELGNPQIVACPGNLDMEVQERGLVTQDGSDTASGSFIAHAEAGLGSVTFTIPGADELTINFGDSGSMDVVHNGITYGTLTVSAAPDGTVGYSFTLNAALDNAAADKPAFLSELTGESGTLQLEVRVTDALGQESAPATIAVSIVDDAPSAMDDEPLLVKEGGAQEVNVLDNDFKGADGNCAVVDAFISDAYGNSIHLIIGEHTFVEGLGTVFLNAGGFLSFTADVMHDHEDFTERTITYTIRDADGDESSAQVLLHRDNLGNPKIDAHPGSLDMTVQERGLVTGDGSNTASGSFTVHTEGGLESVTFLIPGASPLTVHFFEGTGAVELVHNGVHYGALKVFVTPDGTVNYHFELTVPLDNTGDNRPAFLSDLTGEDGILKFEAYATDFLGQKSDPVPLVVRVLDDTPELVAHEGAVNVMPTSEGSGLLTLAPGADGADWSTFTVNGVKADFGGGNHAVVELDNGIVMDLILHPDGEISFSYTMPKQAADGEEFRFTFAVMDRDGDPAEATIVHTADIPDPITAVRAALLGVDQEHDPLVTLSLADAGYNQADSIDTLVVMSEDRSLTFERIPDGNGGYTFTSPGSAYVIAIDANGMITVTLADAGKPAAAENLNIRNGADGTDGGFILAAGSTSGDQTGQITDWPPLPPSITDADALLGTWAGAINNHLSDDTTVLEDGVIYDAEGKPLHLQYRDTSVTADAADGEALVHTSIDFHNATNVDPDASHNSVLISNESTVSGIVIEHKTPEPDGHPYSCDSTSDEYTPKDYTADLTATLIAKGQDAYNMLHVLGGKAVISAGGGEQPASGSADESRISALYAMEGGTVNVYSDAAVEVVADSAGYSTNASRPTVVTAVRSDGGQTSEEDYKSGYKLPHVLNSKTKVFAATVSATAIVSGDTSAQDHSDITYAAVAATEQGHVELHSTEGDVTISVVNEASGDNLETSGMYGIYSGYGLGQNDMASRDDFHGDDGDLHYKSYMKSVVRPLYWQQTYDNGDVCYGEESGEQSIVNVSSAGNVNVNVDLGRADYYGDAAGIVASLGDVRISALDDITISTRLQGENRGSGLSAIRNEFGIIDLNAGGDITLKLEANGDNLSVVHLLPEYGRYNEDFCGYKNPPADIRLSGRDVSIEGIAGRDGTAHENHISGIYMHRESMDDSLAAYSMAVDAEEAFRIDVSAHSNGGPTSATGIAASASLIHDDYKSTRLVLAANAPEVSIKAAVTRDEGSLLPADSRATGLDANNALIVLMGKEAGSDQVFGYGSAQDIHDSFRYKLAMDKLSIQASGGRYNTGIAAAASIDNMDDSSSYMHASVGVSARELDITVVGGAASGASAGYGVNASTADAARTSYDYKYGTFTDYNGSAEVHLRTNDLTLRVEDASKAVGLRADGVGSMVMVGGLHDAYSSGEVVRQSGAISVIIECALTGKEQLGGIAIEAVNGGYVSINGGDYNDRVLLTGALVSGEDSHIYIHTGDGNDVLAFNGQMDSATGDYSTIAISGGDGHDVLVLNAPDSDTFNWWYRGWLESTGLNDLDCESLIIQGVTDPDQVQWLLAQAQSAGINVQVYGPETDITYVNDLSQLANDGLDGSGDHDLLYVRCNTDQSDKLHLLIDALADGKVNGCESLLLDMVDDKTEAGLDVSFLGDVLNAMQKANSGAKLLLRVDAANGLNVAGSGWSTTGATETVNGISYQVYTNTNEQTVYVQQVAAGHSVSGTAGTAGSVEDDYPHDGAERGEAVITETATAYTAVNEDKHSGLYVRHTDPLEPSLSGGVYNAGINYKASVVTAASAAYEPEEPLNIDKSAKDVTLSVGGNLEAAKAFEADAAFVSGAFALEGGAVRVSGKNVTVEAASTGSSQDPVRMAVVTGLRAHGAQMNEGEYLPFPENNATIDVTAGQNLEVSATILGSATTQSYANLTFAGAAATENGQVTLEAGGNVSVAVNNQSAGNTLDAAGVYGVFSGYGLTANDLPAREDFSSDSDYQQYVMRLSELRHEAANATSEGQQSKVSLTAANDVNVAVNLGSQDFSGQAAAIKTSYGDVSINAGGNVHISTSLQGEYRGDEELSAVSLAVGPLHVKAAGDIHINLSANGANLAGVSLPEVISYNHRVQPSSLSGENVRINANAGLDGTAYVNQVAGVSFATGNSYKTAFQVDAQEEFSINATARHNGGATSATGVQVSGANAHGYKSAFIEADAPSVSISARVTGNATRLPQESYATAVSVTDSALAMYASSGQSDEHMWHAPGARFGNDQMEAMDGLHLSAQGGRYNTGIQAVSSPADQTPYGRTDEGQTNMILTDMASSVFIKARNLDIAVTGNPGAVGDTAGYGIQVSSDRIAEDQYAHYDGYKFRTLAQLETDNLSINVSDNTHSVGISASGGNTGVEVAAMGALSMLIACRVTDPASQLRGIALEAVEGGHIAITSADVHNEASYNDSIRLDGDVVLGSYRHYDPETHDVSSPYTSSVISTIKAQTGNGADLLDITGTVRFGKAAHFMVDSGDGNDTVQLGGVNMGKAAMFAVALGEGNDLFRLDGDFVSGQNSAMCVEGGEGNDLFMVNGKIEGYTVVEEGSASTLHNLSISGGGGNDMLVLSAPDAATFAEWYQDWLTGGEGLEHVQAENIIMHGIPANELPDWISALASQHSGVDFQFYGADVNLNVLNDASTLADFTLDGNAGNNDLLYIRFDSPQNLGQLGDALETGSIQGVESLVLDMTDHDSVGADLSALDGLFDSLGRHNQEANVYLRIGQSDATHLEGHWEASDATDTVNGTEYTIYTHTQGEDTVQLYVHLATDNN